MENLTFEAFSCFYARPHSRAPFGLHSIFRKMSASGKDRSPKVGKCGGCGGGDRNLAGFQSTISGFRRNDRGVRREGGEMDREGGRAKKEELFGGGSGRVAFDVNEKGRGPSVRPMKIRFVWGLSPVLSTECAECGGGRPKMVKSSACASGR